MDEPLWDWLPRAVWRWRWERHLTWLRREATLAQERTFRQAGYGDSCACSPIRPGAALSARLRALEQIEEEMRVLIYYE